MPPVPLPNELVLDPKAEPEPELKLDPPNPLAPVDPPLELPPEAIPSPAPIPGRSCPKKPFTVVLFSPTWISRQSALPVSGSAYRCRRNFWLLVFSS